MDRVERIAYVPHEEVLNYTCASQVLLLLVNNVPNVMGHIPGKTYEYIGSRRPVLAVGPPEADFAKVIRKTQSGTVCGFEDKEGMKKELLRLYRLFKKTQLANDPAEEAVSQFTRRAATGTNGQSSGGIMTYRDMASNHPPRLRKIAKDITKLGRKGSFSIGMLACSGVRFPFFALHF